MSESTTHFGYRDVPESEKARLVGEVFTSVAKKYDVMNDLMSFGAHRVWKRFFVATSGVRAGDVVLDLAGGTGDIAALLLPRVGDKGAVVVGDINADMLRVGRDRLLDHGRVRGLDYAQLDAEALPFPDKSFDCVTMAFGLRNVTHKDRALAEIHRVLKIGGRALCSSSRRCAPNSSSRSTISIRSMCCRGLENSSPAMKRAIAISPNRSASTRIRLL